MKKSEVLNTLSTIFDNTFGNAAVKGYGISTTFSGDGDNIFMQIKFNTVFHFASEVDLQKQKENLEAESSQLINDAVAAGKKEFKERAGYAIKCKPIDGHDLNSIEMVSASVYSPRKIAHYRRQIGYEIL